MSSNICQIWYISSKHTDIFCDPGSLRWHCIWNFKSSLIQNKTIRCNTLSCPGFPQFKSSSVYLHGISEMLPPPCFVCFHSFWSFGRKGGVSLLQSDVGKHPPISGSFSLDRPNAYKRGCPALSNTFPFQNKNLEQKLVIRRKDLWLQGNIQACLWQRTESCQVSIRRRKSCLLCLYRVLHFW